MGLNDCSLTEWTSFSLLPTSEQLLAAWTAYTCITITSSQLNHLHTSFEGLSSMYMLYYTCTGTQVQSKLTQQEGYNYSYIVPILRTI